MLWLISYYLTGTVGDTAVDRGEEANGRAQKEQMGRTRSVPNKNHSHLPAEWHFTVYYTYYINWLRCTRIFGATLVSPHHTKRNSSSSNQYGSDDPFKCAYRGCPRLITSLAWQVHCQRTYLKSPRRPLSHRRCCWMQSLWCLLSPQCMLAANA